MTQSSATASLRTALVLTALLATTASGLSAQGRDRTTLRGVVVDQTGGVLGGATIVITNEETAASRELTTDEDGRFVAPALLPGRYHVFARLDGFKQTEVSDVVLNPDTPLDLRIQLAVGTRSESVIVSSSEVTMVNVVDATRGNAIQEREVSNLPMLARNPLGLLSLQPGVVFTGATDLGLLVQGAFSIDWREGAANGVRGNQTNVQLDGVDANDFQTQAPFMSVLPISMDSLQEFRVVTTNANATDGVASGAQVQLVTKSGSIEFHGNLREYNRDTALAANSFFSNRSGLPKPKLQRNVYGGSLGGPAVRNRTFFFFDFEGRRDSSETPQARNGPSDTLKSGLLTYRTTNGSTATLTPADILRLDPAHLGENQYGLQYLSLYPTANDPASGPDGGLNFATFRFNAPVTTNNKIYTGRVDQKLSQDGHHALSIRGTVGDLAADTLAAQYPGLPPRTTLLNTSTGLVANYTGQLGPNVLDTLRYGFTRQALESSGIQGPVLANTTIGAAFAGGDTFSGTGRPNGRTVPVHEINDDVTLLRGRHTVQFGGLARFTRDHASTEQQSYPTFNSAVAQLRTSPQDPYAQLLATGDPSKIPANQTIFTQAFMALTGTVSIANATFLTDPKTGQLLPVGTSRVRDFAENGVEAYFHDTWRLSRLTVSAGVRYSVYTPIWETNGAMVRPTVDVQSWWNQRQADMNAGVPSWASPLIAYDLAGKANGRPGWYDTNWKNVAPRVSLAYSPEARSGLGKWLFGDAGKSSIRAGFGMYYDRLGGALSAATDKFGSPGTSTTIGSLSGLYDLATAPRLAGNSTLTATAVPPLSAFVTAPAAGVFPFALAAAGSSAFGGFMLDNRLQTPYELQATFSVQRELPHRVLLDVGYVGTFGRQLLQNLNLAQYYGNFRDNASRQNLWGAYNQIVDLIGNDPTKPAISPNDTAALSKIAPIAFFENLLPNLPAFTKNPNLTPTQAFYLLAARANGDWTQVLRSLDVNLTPGNSPWNTTVDPRRTGYVLFQPQYRGLNTWMNGGRSNYNSLQITVRRSVGSALFGFNYVLSKAEDNGSTPENNDTIFGAAGSDQITNAFRPNAGYAPSNFDVRHNFNAHTVIELPFGRGQRFGANADAALNALIGGWTVASVWRWRSGFPLSITNGLVFPTNPLNQGPATVVGPLNTSITENGAFGLPNLFADPAAALSQVQWTRPGEVGSRNVIRGPGFFTLDLDVHKRIVRGLEFRATAFNALNNVNFTTAFFNSNLRIDSGTTFGNLTSTAGARGGAREVELALRYTF